MTRGEKGIYQEHTYYRTHTGLWIDGPIKRRSETGQIIKNVHRGSKVAYPIVAKFVGPPTDVETANTASPKTTSDQRAAGASRAVPAAGARRERPSTWASHNAPPAQERQGNT